MSSGDKFGLKCYKCGSWYNASCHWYTVQDKIMFQRRGPKGVKVWRGVDADGEQIPQMDEIFFPRIKVENIEAHKCEKGKKWET